MIAKAKDEDKSKRQKLEVFYAEVEDCIKQLDFQAIEILDVYNNGRGILNVLEEKRKRLKKRDYNILIAGTGLYSLYNTLENDVLHWSYIESVKRWIKSFHYF